MENKKKNVAWAIFRTATQLGAVLAVILFTFSACGKDKDDDKINPKDLVGHWYVTETTFEGQNVFRSCFSGDKVDLTESLFRRNVRVSDTGNCVSETIEGAYTISGNKIIMKLSNGTEKTYGISVSGNKLTVTADTGEGNFVLVYERR